VGLVLVARLLKALAAFASFVPEDGAHVAIR
jgi:hypothetical protein